MLRLLFNWCISALAIGIAAYVLPGVHVGGVFPALVLAVVLGFINAVIKPILLILTLPVTILSLGLFALVINGALILLADSVVAGFDVASFGWAVLFSIVLSLVNWFLGTLKE